MLDRLCGDAGRQWQAKEKRAAPALFAGKPDGTTLRLNKFAREKEPDTHAAVIILGFGMRTEKWLKYMLLLSLGNADALILHGDNGLQIFDSNIHRDLCIAMRL